MKAAGRIRSLPLDKRVLCAWLISFAVVCPLLSLMDLRYGRQLSNWWYLLFSAGLWLLWLLLFRARRAAAAGVAAVLLVCAALYFAALPPYTYRQAISLLEQQYPDQVFSPAPAGSSALAPHYDQGRRDYERYVVLAGGQQYYYFDQFTGESGRITTAPASHSGTA